MYRNNRREGHDSIGTTTPATNYYLAEGTTAYGFTTYVLIQNPNSSPASVTLTYMTPSGAKPQGAITLPANSRKTIKVNDVAGMGNTDFSTKVTGSKPIIAERSMYWGAGTALGEACHDSIGMDSPHTTFYLPDGQSSEGRETYTLVQNPNTSPVTVQISYLTPTGTGDVLKTETIPANSRKTFDMASHSGINGRASIMVKSKTSGKKIMVERSMYWNARGAGTDTIGGYGD
jgi:LEA14-like dessication related protein